MHVRAQVSEQLCTQPRAVTPSSAERCGECHTQGSVTPVPGALREGERHSEVHALSLVWALLPESPLRPPQAPGLYLDSFEPIG